MARLKTYLLIAVLCALSLVSCSRRGRVIPESDMTSIYMDMFMADQWLTEFSKYTARADTTLFYDPIFKKYGYTFNDFRQSLEYYVDHPDKYMKIMTKASKLLDEMAVPVDAAIERERQYNITKMNAHYKTKDFSSDSVRWHSPLVLWPSATNDDVKGKDSLRTDTQQAPRKLVGDKPIAPRRETLQL